MKTYINLRGNLSKYANERIECFERNDSEFITIVLKDGYKFASTGTQKTVVRTITELQKVTKVSNIVKAENKKVFNANEVRSKLTETANKHVITIMELKSVSETKYMVRLTRGFKLVGYTPEDNGAYEFETLAKMIDALNSSEIVEETSEALKK